MAGLPDHAGGGVLGRRSHSDETQIQLKDATDGDQRPVHVQHLDQLHHQLPRKQKHHYRRRDWHEVQQEI